MKTEMVIRNPANVRDGIGGCTDFVLHKSQQTIFTGIQKKIVDYTEHRLLRYTASIQDPQQKLQLTAMINDYRAGNVAIAWKQGRPVYVRVIKEIAT